MLERKRHIKVELCIRLSVYGYWPCWQETGEVLGTNGFHVKAENERFTAAGWRCRQNMK